MQVFQLPKVSIKENIIVNSNNYFQKPLISTGYNYYAVQTNDGFYKLVLAPENIGKKFYYIIENYYVHYQYNF